MTSKYATFHTYMGSQGTSIQDANKSTTIRMLNDSFEDNPFYQSLLINGTNVDCIVEKMENYFNKRLLFKSTNTNEIGELVTLDSLNWLIIDYQNNGVMPKAIIHQCNHQLKWLNSNGDIKSAYGVVSNKSDIDAIDEKKYIVNLPSGELKITITNNADTLLITRDKRFIVNGNAWKCNFNDYTTKPGLCVISLVEDIINDNDNLILGIADYYNQHDYVLTILNDDLILVEGDALQLNCSLTDNGVVVNNPTLIYVSDNIETCTVNSSGLVTAILSGLTTITVSYGDIDSTINVTVQELLPTNSYTLEISGDNIIKPSETKTYILKTYNNGILTTNPACTWDITGNDLIIVSQTNDNCIVFANNSIGVSNILSVSINDFIPIISNSITINIEGMW